MKVKPPIFADVTDDLTIAKDEIFGPIVAVLPFDKVEEVIERANNTPFGLAAGVWTGNIKIAHKVAIHLKAGTAWINDYNLPHSVVINNHASDAKWAPMR